MGIIILKIILEARVKTVWEFITKPENFPKYVYGYASGKTTSPNAIGIGASYEWYGQLGPFRFKSIEEIVDWQERKYVAYNGQLSGIKFDSSMKVKKIRKQTLLTVFIKYKVPFYLGGILADLLLIRWIIKSYIQKSLNNLDKRYSQHPSKEKQLNQNR